MRKLLVGLALTTIAGFTGSAASAAFITENFDQAGGFFGTSGQAGNLPSVPVVPGWAVTNASSPVGTTSWHSNNGSIPFAPHAGTGYAAVDKNSTTGQNTISNWLMTPQLSFNAGDVLTFWTRTDSPVDFPDRLQVRLSLAGASTNTGGTAVSFGDFSTLLTTINPNLTAAGYPTVWTRFDVPIASSGSGRIGFRYFVTDAGPSGTNGNFIGIDSLSITPEPATLGVIGIVTAGLMLRRRNRVG